MEIDFLFEDYDKNTHKLSNESLQETRHLLDFISQSIRFEYDKFKKLTANNDFKQFAELYIESGQAKSKKDMISHLSNVKMQIISTELKEQFVNLLSVEEQHEFHKD